VVATRKEPPILPVAIVCFFSEGATEIDEPLLYSALVGVGLGNPEPYCKNTSRETVLEEPMELYCFLLECSALSDDVGAPDDVGYTVVYSVTYTHSMAAMSAGTGAGFAVVLTLQLSAWRGCRAPLTRAMKKIQ
jgi:hypothetical protein